MKKQLLALAKVFPQDFIKQKEMGKRSEDYLPYGTIAQRLLEVCGNYDWDFEVIYSENIPVAVKGKLSVIIDNQHVEVHGSGTPQNLNEPVGEQIKKMESDSFKRCARNIGLGLHLWTGSNPYWLEKVLVAQNTDTKKAVQPTPIKPTGTAT